MKKPNLEDRLRQYLAREPEAPAGLDQPMLRLDQLRGRRAPGWRAQTLVAAAFLIAVAGIASAVHVARQNADKPRPTPTVAAPTPTAVVPTATTSGAPVGVPGSVSSIHMITPLIGWAEGAETSEDRTLIVDLVILRTTDGGAHWKNVSPPLSFSWQPGTTQYLNENTAWTASIQPRTSVLRTTDGGNHWLEEPISDQQALGPPVLNFVDAKHGWVLIGRGAAAGSEDAALYQTSDGGAHWLQIAVTDPGNRPGHIPFGGQKNGLSFINANTGWLTGHAGAQPLVYVSHDGGRTWNPQHLTAPPGIDLAGGANISAPRFFSSTSGELVVDAMRTVIYTTQDGGASWQPHVAPDTGSSDFLDGSTGWLISADGQTLYRTSDGGRHWQSVRLRSALSFVQRLAFVTPMVGYAVQSPPTGLEILMKTEDGGVTWTKLTIAVS